MLPDDLDYSSSMEKRGGGRVVFAPAQSLDQSDNDKRWSSMENWLPASFGEDLVPKRGGARFLSRAPASFEAEKRPGARFLWAAPQRWYKWRRLDKKSAISDTNVYSLHHNAFKLW